MADLRKARRNLYAAAIVLLVVDVIALFILISPAGVSVGGQQRENEFRQLHGDVQKKIRTVVPPEKVQQRIVEARTQIAEFIRDRIPSESSALSIELGKLASEAGVQLGSVRYNEQDSDIAGLRHVGISATISGTYLQEVKFINALERAKMLFVIDSVGLGEGQGGGVRLSINMDAYLRERS